MCLDNLINIVTAICTLALAAVAIWQDQILNFLNPARGEIARSNFEGKEEGTSEQRVYTYHVKAVSRRRWRPLKGAVIRFRQVNRVTDAGKEETSVYPVWRQSPWAPAERSEIKQTIMTEQECDLGRYEQQQDRFVIAYYQPQGGEFDSYILRGQVGRIFLHLSADNLRRDAVAEVTIDLKGANRTKPAISLTQTGLTNR